MSAPKHEWSVGDRAEVIGHQTQAQGIVVALRKARYYVGVQFASPHDPYFTYWYAPGQLKFLGPTTTVLHLGIHHEGEGSLCGADGASVMLPSNVTCSKCKALYEGIVIQNPRPENPTAPAEEPS